MAQETPLLEAISAYTKKHNAMPTNIYCNFDSALDATSFSMFLWVNGKAVYRTPLRDLEFVLDANESGWRVG